MRAKRDRERKGVQRHDIDRLQRQFHRMRLGLRLRRGMWEIGSPKTCEPELQPLATALHTMHLCVSRTEIAEIRLLDDNAMLEAVARFTTREIAPKIMAILKAHWTTNDAKILRFRASVVYSMSKVDEYCVVVQWLEIDDVEVVAIFNMRNPKRYSWLAHYAKLNSASCGKDGERWSDTRVYLEFESMPHLRALFEASQNLAGVLQWPTKDIVRLYCRVQPEEIESDEEYNPIFCKFGLTVPESRGITR